MTLLILAVMFVGVACSGVQSLSKRGGGLVPKSRLTVTTAHGEPDQDVHVDHDSSTIDVESGTFKDPYVIEVETPEGFRDEVDGKQVLNPVKVKATDENGNPIGEGELAKDVILTITVQGPLDKSRLQVIKIKNLGAADEARSIIPNSALTIKDAAGGMLAVSFATRDLNATYVLVLVPAGIALPQASLAGAPSGESAAPVLDVTVGGVGVAEYRYDLVNGTDCAGATYGAWTGVSAHIKEAAGVDGPKVLCVQGRDVALNEQTTATAAAWTKVPPAAPAATLTGAPTGTNNALTLDVTVMGGGVIEYRYDLLDGSDCASATYGNWTSIAIHITEAPGADGPKVLCVLGRNAAANEQTVPTTAVWTKDATAPAATLSGAPTGTNSATVLDVTVAGTDVAEYRFDLVNGSDCASASYGDWTSVATHITRAPGVDGAKTLCVIGRDVTLNAQATPTAATWTKDATPPTATLSGAPTGTNGATSLDVTVAGADVVEYSYDLVSGASCAAASYGAWTPVGTHITEAPGADGAKILCVLGRDVTLNVQAAATTASWLKDTVAPTAGAFQVSTNISATGYTLHWAAGSDVTTPVGSLQYYVCSGADAASIDTVTECEGETQEMDWTTAKLDLTIVGKAPSSTQYYNVIVRDGSLLKALYGGKSETTTTVVTETKLTASDANGSAYYGISTAVSRNTVVVGALGAGLGTAYVYRLDPSDGLWKETKLTPSDGSGPSDYFGVSIAVSDDSIIVGARAKNSNAGAAYIYRYDSSDNLWKETKLTASDSAANDYFGASVGMSGNLAVVGASSKASGIGAAYIYRYDPSDNLWKETKITASDGHVGAQFGNSIGVSGNTLVVGALGQNGLGAAYVYRYDPSDDLWKETKLLPSDGGSNFAFSVSISGNTVVSTKGDSAYVYRFDPSDNVWRETKIVPSDSFPEFGYSSSISGNSLIVGARNSSGVGAAYLYQYDPSDNLWKEAKITASDGSSANLYGSSVGISGNTMVVGAYGVGGATGTAYIYRKEVVEADGETKLVASDGASSHAYGISAAISENTVVVGADHFASNKGAAYVYRFDPSDSIWKETKLTASDGAVGDYFGWSTAVSGNSVLIGAYGHSSGRGAAYLFRFDPSDNLWKETKLTASDADIQDYFGWGTAISGNLAVVGAYNDASGTGSVYLYQLDPSDSLWKETKITAADGAPGDFFGGRVGASATTVVVGAYAKASSTGAVYVYRHDAGSWHETKLTASDPNASDGLGYSVAVSGNTVVAGAAGKSSNAGAVYVFRLDPTSNSWNEAKITPSDAGAGNNFGSSVAISGSSIAVGSPGKASNTGAGYVYRLDPSSNLWNETKLNASDAATSDVFGYSAGISGTAAVFGAWGKSSGAGAAYLFKAD